MTAKEQRSGVVIYACTSLAVRHASQYLWVPERFMNGAPQAHFDSRGMYLLNISPHQDITSQEFFADQPCYRRPALLYSSTCSDRGQAILSHKDASASVGWNSDVSTAGHHTVIGAQGHIVHARLPSWPRHFPSQHSLCVFDNTDVSVLMRRSAMASTGNAEMLLGRRGLLYLGGQVRKAESLALNVVNLSFGL